MRPTRTRALTLASAVLLAGGLALPAVAADGPDQDQTPAGEPVEDPTPPAEPGDPEPPAEPPAATEFGPWTLDPVLEPQTIEACGTSVTISGVEETWSGQSRQRVDEFGNEVIEIRGITELRLDPEEGETLVVDASGPGTITVNPGAGMLHQTGTGNWFGAMADEYRDDQPFLPDLFLTDGPVTLVFSGIQTEETADDEILTVEQPEAHDVCAMLDSGEVPTPFQPAVELATAQGRPDARSERGAADAGSVTLKGAWRL